MSKDPDAIREIEAKFRLDDPATLEARLAALEAPLLMHVLELNTILDADDRRLFNADSGLRVRTSTFINDDRQPVTKLTFKGPRAPDDGNGVKSRLERETEVADADALLAILAKLGYHPRVVFEKRRRIYRIEPGAAVTIDELPRLGFFCEIEAQSAEQIMRIRDELELPAESAVGETYVGMVAKVTSADADGVHRASLLTRARPRGTNPSTVHDDGGAREPPERCHSPETQQRH